MNRLPMTVANFATTDERKEGYLRMPEYCAAFSAGKIPLGEKTFAEADKIMSDWFLKEVETMSGKSLENFSNNLEVFANMRDVQEVSFAILGMVTDLILPDALIKDLGYLVDIKFGAFGESLKIDMQPRDLFVVSKGGRNKRSFDLKRQYKGTATIIPEPRTISVGISLYDILRGAYSLAEFIMKAVRSLEAQMKYDIYDAFTTAVNTLSAAGDSKLKFAGYVETDAISLAQKVTAWNGGKKAIFLGTRVALKSMLPASTNYRFTLGDEYFTLGHVRDFNGFAVVELEQIADYTTEFKLKLKDDEIYVISPMSDKIIKGFVEGSTLSNVNGNFANANLQVGADLVKSWGVGAHTSSIAGVIIL